MQNPPVPTAEATALPRPRPGRNAVELAYNEIKAAIFSHEFSAGADSITRMLPGVLANDEAFQQESHYSSLLEYPQYTRPNEWHGAQVPDVLLSGHHANIVQWRREQSLQRTWARRPEMLDTAELDKIDKEFLGKQERKE